MNVLVVGGAGYIGSHAMKYLIESGHNAMALDNLGLGHRAAVPEGRLIVGDASDIDHTTDVLKSHKIDAVMHFAAFAAVNESVNDPAKYYQNNVCATINLLQAMRQAGVRQFVFSSTTATYGEPDVIPIAESTPQQPINPYGFTKLVVEQALADYAQAYGFAYAALRYFNAAGAAADGSIGEDHTPESHLIPIVLQVALGQRDAITIYGDDYPTPDGTCIRDYIHVDDLASAHLAALNHLQPGKGLCLNLGTGTGTSVRQIVDTARDVTGHPIPEIMGSRRAGDPPELVADSRAAQSTLGWKPFHTTPRSIIETAWNWHRKHPNGYRSRD
ncbi:MAG: UDP-glucose 4-epimerase GalE [Planctomycetota bacterium]